MPVLYRSWGYLRRSKEILGGADKPCTMQTTIWNATLRGIDFEKKEEQQEIHRQHHVEGLEERRNSPVGALPNAEAPICLTDDDLSGGFGSTAPTDRAALELLWREKRLPSSYNVLLLLGTLKVGETSCEAKFFRATYLFSTRNYISPKC